MSRSAAKLLLLAAVLPTLPAQTLLIPAAATTGDLSSTTGWPFDVVSNMRILYVYDSSHFTTAGITSPIVITRLRLRANGAAATWPGETISSVTVDLSTAPLDYNVISTTYDSNHGPDRAQVWNGSVAIPGGSSTAGSAGPFVVDINFSTPFLYDPNSGDLTIDYVSSGPTVVTNTPTLDASSTTGQALARRVYTLGYTGGTTGTLWAGESAHAIEFTYGVAAGYASSQSYGAGCYDRAGSVYEAFTGATFDLDTGSPTNSIQFTPSGAGGYIVVPGSNQFFAPTSTDLLLTDDSLAPAQTLPFAFPFGGTTTNAIRICSNGFLWLNGTETSADLSPTASELLQLAPRIAPHWTDLNPATLVGGVRVGSIHYDVNPVSGHAICTWLTVPEFGNPGNLSTFQVDLAPTGAFELRWQSCTLTATRALMTGASKGLGARDGGSVDLSTALPLVTFADAEALRLSLSARPRLGTTVQLATSNPSSQGVGVNFLGLAAIPAPGFDLAPLGAAGCVALLDINQAIGNVISNLGLPGTSLQIALPIPANPALAGLSLWTQSIWLDAAANALGLLSSNGQQLRLDVN
jgi:hypothetical protein